MNLFFRHAFCLTGLLLFSFATKLQALDPLRAPSQYQYTEWNMTQGLPYSSVRGVYQTSDGFLWLATRAGLSRFDSVSFTNFTSAEMGGITVDEVSFFAEDTRHRLWIGTKNGVVWYEQGHWSQPVLGPELERADITGLLSDGNGMYVATRNQVMRWEEGRLSVVNLGTEITLNSYFESLCRARNGDLLVVGNTVVRVKKDGGSEIFDRKRLIPNSSVIRAVAEDRSGGLWLATTVGLYLWKGNRLERLPKSNGFSINVVRSLCMDRDDNLWIGTQNGLLRYSQGKLANVYINGNESLSHILYIREDIEGNLWAGTDAGLMRLRDVKITNFTIRDGLPTNSIQTMLKARSGGVWVGTVGGGLVRMQQDGVRIFNQGALRRRRGRALDQLCHEWCRLHALRWLVGAPPRGLQHYQRLGRAQPRRRMGFNLGQGWTLPAEQWHLQSDRRPEGHRRDSCTDPGYERPSLGCVEPRRGHFREREMGSPLCA
jgi:ligand-binding sensor domain-containing protein